MSGANEVSDAETIIFRYNDFLLPDGAHIHTYFPAWASGSEQNT